MDDARYQRIEERVAWLERHVLEQDKAMLEQSRLVEALRKQLAELRERRGRSESAAPGGSDIFEGDEKPPHY